MVDRRGEDLPRLVEVAAGTEHVVDLGAVLGPFLDLVEITVVRDQRLVGLFGGPAYAIGSYSAGRTSNAASPSSMSAFWALANLNLHQREALLQRPIMSGAKPIISPPIHSFWLRWERVRDAEIATAQTLSNLLGFKDQAVTNADLPRCIAQIIAMATSPGVVARTKQL
jgi:hypothetical protein